MHDPGFYLRSMADWVNYIYLIEGKAITKGGLGLIGYIINIRTTMAALNI